MQTTSQPLEPATGRTLLSLTEAATIIGVSARTVRDYVTSGRLAIAQHTASLQLVLTIEEQNIVKRAIGQLLAFVAREAQSAERNTRFTELTTFWHYLNV